MQTSPWAWLNGEFLPLEQLRISPLDRGFLFGDGVYEVIPVHRGQAFALTEHLQRLDRSLAAIGIAPPLPLQDWERMIAELIERNDADELSVYLQVTRGVVAVRSHQIPAQLQPTLVAFCQDLPQADPQIYATGITAITHRDERWEHCDIKATSLLGNVLLARQAMLAGAAEAILHRDQMVTEGSSSNVFVVHHGQVRTPPKSQWILPGITRDLTLAALASLDIPATEAPISLQDLRAADEIWITSSTRDIAAVTVLDGNRVGDGRPGPVWQRVLRALRETD